jgi:hypothetical protein
VREKQCWGIKIKKFYYNTNSIDVGICLKSVAEKSEFYLNDINFKEESNGCYLIDRNGRLWFDL